MPRRRLRFAPAAASQLAAGIQQIQSEQAVQVAFSDAASSAAHAAASAPRLPALDRTDLALLTIDPPGSMDLDQAMHIERDGEGYLVHYAIADLSAFVTPGGTLDQELRRRGESLYGGGASVPLHPSELGEGAASLLPDQVRPAYLWTLRLDKAGALLEAAVEPARVKSRQRLDYAGVQAQIDSGAAEPTLMLLREVGLLRQQQEQARGGVQLALPEQQVDVTNEGWQLSFRVPLPVEDWNAQISLLTGYAAAAIMLKGGVGLLRTLPAPATDAIDHLRRTAQALDVVWPDGQSYADFIRALDPSLASHVAVLVAATSLLRGAAYAAFDGTPPEHPEHAALASTYAHVTAPLRRLADRYTLATCAALHAGEPVPDWVSTCLPTMPAVMQDADHRAHAYERAVLDLVEAQVLSASVGERFDGVVLSTEHDGAKGQLMLREPAVEAKVTGTALPVGQPVSAVLTTADPTTRTVLFAVTGP